MTREREREEKRERERNRVKVSQSSGTRGKIVETWTKKIRL